MKNKGNLKEELTENLEKIEHNVRGEPGLRCSRVDAGLLKSQIFFRSILDGIQDGIYVLDKELNIIESNYLIEQWYVQAQPLPGKKCHLAFRGRSEPCAICPAVRAFQLETLQTNVLPWIGNGGENRGWLELNAYPLFDEHGEVTVVICHMRDITKRKMAENEVRLYQENLEELVKDRTHHLIKANEQLHKEINERRRAEEALRKSEEKYRTILENIKDGYFEVDVAGNLVFYNNYLCGILGYPPEELKGLNYRCYTAPDYIPKVYKAFNELYHTKQPSKLLDWEIIKKDGSRGFIEVSITLIYGADQQIAGFRGIMRDITELRRIQKIVRKREKLAIIGQMAAGMAHEIKNLLTVVRGLTQLLKKKSIRESGFHDHIDVIIGEIDRANNVIAEFLQLARPKPPVLENNSADALVNETLDIVGPQAFLKNIQVDFASEGDLPGCLMDRNQMKQVLLNICQNAIEAMPEGGLIRFKTGLSVTKNEVFIDVQDNGCGIPRGELENIGVPFYTTKADGTGLGLSISYAIVDAHKGRIEIESSEGEGTRFRIYLPVFSHN